MKLKLFIKFYLISYNYYVYTLSQFGAKLVVFFFRARIPLLKYIKTLLKSAFFSLVAGKSMFLRRFVRWGMDIVKL